MPSMKLPSCDTKKMYCLQAWNQCIVVGAMCFHGELLHQKYMYPSGQTPQSLASASCSSHERALPVFQMARTGRYNTSCARRRSSTPGLSHGGGTYYQAGTPRPVVHSAAGQAAAASDGHGGLNRAAMHLLQLLLLRPRAGLAVAPLGLTV
jgi:hypothetical protein